MLSRTHKSVSDMLVCFSLLLFTHFYAVRPQLILEADQIEAGVKKASAEEAEAMKRRKKAYLQKLLARSTPLAAIVSSLGERLVTDW